MEQNINIQHFLDSDGRVKLWPQRQRLKQAVLAYVIGHFEHDHMYTGKEVNAILDEAHTFGDYFLLRRELVDRGLLCRKRDGSQYWRAPQEILANAEAQPDCLPT